MPYRITITEKAERQLRSLTVRQQRILEEAIAARLPNDPLTPTNAIRRLRPNSFAQYELRAGDLRVLYNVEGDEVILLVIGRKQGNRLLVEGKEFHDHQDDPAESPGDEPATDPQ